MVVLGGEVVEPFKFNHEIYGERFYSTSVRVPRESGVSDFVPVIVSERLINVNEDMVGRYVEIAGEFRSYSNRDKDNHKIILSVFPKAIKEVDKDYYINGIVLDGTICKKKELKKMTSDREMTMLFIAIDRGYKKSDYIPCMLWGKHAYFAQTLEVGTRIKVTGRIQSRMFVKKFEDGSAENGVAYEVSCSTLHVLED